MTETVEGSTNLRDTHGTVETKNHNNEQQLTTANLLIYNVTYCFHKAIIRSENPRVGGSIPPLGTIHNSYFLF